MKKIARSTKTGYILFVKRFLTGSLPMPIVIFPLILILSAAAPEWWFRNLDHLEFRMFVCYLKACNEIVMDRNFERS